MPSEQHKYQLVAAPKLFPIETGCQYFFLTAFVKLWFCLTFFQALNSLKMVFLHNIKVFCGCKSFITDVSLTLIMDYSISSGLITLKGFFQVQNHQEYQNVVIISFVHLEKINIFCFMHQGVAQKLSLPRPLEN